MPLISVSHENTLSCNRLVHESQVNNSSFTFHIPNIRESTALLRFFSFLHYSRSQTDKNKKPNKIHTWHILHSACIFQSRLFSLAVEKSLAYVTAIDSQVKCMYLYFAWERPCTYMNNLNIQWYCYVRKLEKQKKIQTNSDKFNETHNHSISSSEVRCKAEAQHYHFQDRSELFH